MTTLLTIVTVVKKEKKSQKYVKRVGHKKYILPDRLRLGTILGLMTGCYEKNNVNIRSYKNVKRRTGTNETQFLLFGYLCSITQAGEGKRKDTLIVV